MLEVKNNIKNRVIKGMGGRYNFIVSQDCEKTTQPLGQQDHDCLDARTVHSRPVLSRRGIKRLFAVLVLSLLPACDSQPGWRYHDPTLQTQEKNYDALTQIPERKAYPQEAVRKPKKKKRSYIASDPSLPKCFQTKATLSLTKAIPLGDVFMALAEQIGANITVDPTVDIAVTMHARGESAASILKTLCRQHRLRYEVDGTFVTITRDTPYVRNYDLQYLVLARSNQNRISIATDVFTSFDAKDRGDEDNGSNTNLKTETKTDFWNEVEQNFHLMLGGDAQKSDTSGTALETPAYFTLHRQAGIITVNAPHLVQRQVQNYLEQLRKSVERQVLIEAKILEVNLSKEFKSGINWNLLRSNMILQAPLGGIGNAGAFDPSATPLRNVFSIGGQGRNITSVINILNRFGTVRTLSNPRLTVINNHPAVLKVARQRVYFKLNVSREYNYHQRREEKEVSSDVKTVPIGLMMYVHPSVSEDGRILMTLRPTISQIIREVEDPAVSIASDNQQQSFIPEIQVRELDSVLVMNSGESIVVGGLMQEESSNEKSGLPELSEAPIFGGLFGGKDNSRNVTELVIFLRATVIDADEAEGYVQTSNVDPADRRTYDQFSRDPRPLYDKAGEPGQ